MNNDRLVMGVDFGTDSVRAILVNAANGGEIASSVYYYPRWKKGLYCDPSINQFRQHPLDHIEGLENTIKDCLSQAGKDAPGNLKAISIDTTGSTPVAVDKEGIPLALQPGFEDNPNAMFVLWKDHTAVEEAVEINNHGQKTGTNYLQFVGGIYSSEWFWAKLLKIVRADEKVKAACYSWVEHCDWIPYLLTGGTDIQQMKRSVCAAGHKALWASAFGGLPPDEFFTAIDPLLKGFRQRLFSETYTSDKAAGTLSKEWAKRLGLSTEVIIGVGAFDAHMGAVGGQIEPYYLSKVMGTSTCDILVAPSMEIGETLVKGICGQVTGSVIPGMVGMEAGQSAFGDAYAWFSNLLSWSHTASSPIHPSSWKAQTLPESKMNGQNAGANLIVALSEAASKLPLNENDELAVDWLNGRRSPDADQLLKGAITGLNLASDAPRIYRAIVEATCFGAKAIVDGFISQGIMVKGLIGLGGVARKSPFVMQMMADTMDRPIRIHRSEQTCAAGAAMFAATVAGIYPKVEDAMQAMGQGFDREYFPDPSKIRIYEKRYLRYQQLGNFIEQQTVISSQTNTNIIHSKKYQLIRKAAFEANMQLPKLGLVMFTFGNVSVVDREAGVFAIKPSGVPYDQLSPANMVIVDLEGTVIEGDLRPSSDTMTHAVLYRHWLHIGAIVHTHSTYATAWAQAQRDIPVYGTTHADHSTVNIPCAAPMNDELIKGDYEYQTGYQVINCLKDRELSYEEVEMILVGNHAPFTWGKTTGKAVYNAAVLEEIAKMAYCTEQLNPAAPTLKETLINKHWQRKHGDKSHYGQ